MKTEIMRDASYLLPDPGGEVVRTLLDEIDRLNGVERRLVELQEAVRWERECSKASMSMAVLFASPQGMGEFLITERAARAAVDALVGGAE